MHKAKKMTSPIKYLFVLFVLSLVGCLYEAQNQPTLTPNINNTLQVDTEHASMNINLTPSETPDPIIPTPTNLELVLNNMAYIAYNRGGSEIGILGQEGVIRNIIEDCIFCDSLSWSPNGEWIVFNGSFKIGESTQIYAVNINSGEIKKITNDTHMKTGVSWSPNEQDILYVEEGSSTDLVITNFDGNSIRKITYTTGYETYPTWSPSGGKIAFLYREDRFLEYLELWIMDINGENQKRVTDFPVSFNTISWSPDETEIIFVSNEDCGHLNAVDINESNVRQIINFSGCIQNPSWSSNGEFIMFIGSDSKNTPLNSYGEWQIYITSKNGSHVSQITSIMNWRPIISLFGK